ncbi:hypothetical protein ACFU0X_24475 [Streptomyces cellulosae]|uniref:Uncharacterized protein n=1 Tax=Streptomyces cellulosae TaxID=1968 RepID=A0ABW6JL85_STRCE
MADADTVTIRSTTDPTDGTAACLLTWGPIEALLTPAKTLDTARDLMAAAAHAESDIAFLAMCREQLRLDEQTAGQMLLDIRSRRPAPPTPAALRIHAVAGYKTGRPYVHIARGSQAASLDPDDARQMAVQWTQAATAAQIDVRLRYALGEWDRFTPDEIDRLFLTVQRLGR